MLTKDNSNSIKGFLILLIVFGHNTLLYKYSLSDGTKIEYDWYWFLYSFHVYGFFILPFFYEHKEGVRQKFLRILKKNAIRLLYPYMWICTLCLFIVTKHSFNSIQFNSILFYQVKQNYWTKVSVLNFRGS
jgi:fucose 4-O-acetylase-like acetyltransferase